MEGVDQGPILESERGVAAVLRSFPSGFRFKPKDIELVNIFLKRKITNRKLPPIEFKEVDLYSHDPDTLTAMNGDGSSNGVTEEWYFFTRRAKGSRSRRCAGFGYWRVTGKKKEILSKNVKVGLKRKLAFYVGKSRDGGKTQWRMDEYLCIPDPAAEPEEGKLVDDWSLVRVYRPVKKAT